MQRVVRLPFLLAAIMGLGLLTACQEKPARKSPRIPEVTVAHPLKREVTRYLEYTGNLKAIQYVDIRARVQGFLTEIHFQPRQKVKTGDLLFVIDPRQYQAQVNEAKGKLDAQKAQLKLAQTELEISKQLESKEAVSALKLEKKAAERDVAKADVELAQADLDKAKLDLEWTQVTSPIDGRVSRNLVDVGNLVGATEKTLLTTVVQDDNIYAYFNMSELDLLPLIRKHSAAIGEGRFSSQKAPVLVGLADEKDYPHEGYIDFADTKVDPATGTIQVRGVFPNPDGVLMDGMFVRIRVPVEKQSSLLIPETAIQFDQGGRYVFVVGADGVVDQKRVKMGQKVDEMRVIHEGLSEKDRVITLGVQRARPGAKVNPKESAPESNKAEDAGDKKTVNK
jgi:RND family efflux transporter MFP subunit